MPDAADQLEDSRSLMCARQIRGKGAYSFTCKQLLSENRTCHPAQHLGNKEPVLRGWGGPTSGRMQIKLRGGMKRRRTCSRLKPEDQQYISPLQIPIYRSRGYVWRLHVVRLSVPVYFPSPYGKDYQKVLCLAQLRGIWEPANGCKCAGTTPQGKQAPTETGQISKYWELFCFMVILLYRCIQKRLL